MSEHIFVRIKLFYELSLHIVFFLGFIIQVPGTKVSMRRIQMSMYCVCSDAELKRIAEEEERKLKEESKSDENSETNESSETDDNSVTDYGSVIEDPEAPDGTTQPYLQWVKK